MDSTPVIALIVIVAVIAVGAFLLGQSRGKEESRGKSTADHGTEGDAGIARVTATQMEVAEQPEPLVTFEEVAALTPAEVDSLVEIDDPEVVAQIDAAIPVAAQAVMDAAASGAFNQAVQAHNQAVEATGKVYQAIIPAGAALSNSQAMEGAKRGFYRGKDNIQGNANFVEAQLQTADPNMADALKMANAVNAAMNVASIVVGQYYMSQINGKLDSLEKGIDKIAEFQESQYRSDVMALVAAVQRSATFRLETMQSDEQRMVELISLREREQECARLLGLANEEIRKIASRHKVDYATYERLVDESSSWYDYQQILLRVMDEIAELNYTLSLGARSRENSYALCEPYSKQSIQAQQQLKAWHGDVASKLEIDVAKSRRKKQSLEGVLWTVPGLVNDDLNYIEIPVRTKFEINRQIYGGNTESSRDTTDYYSQEVRIVKRGGKTYYLPPESS